MILTKADFSEGRSDTDATLPPESKWQSSKSSLTQWPRCKGAAIFSAVPSIDGWTRAMDDNDSDNWTDRIGERVSTIFIAALGLMFVYGYLGHFVFG